MSIPVYRIMREGERKIRQEDCHEDSLGAGILTLTNQRIAFDKTQARIMDFTKHVGETILEVPLSDVTRVWREGLLTKEEYRGKSTKVGRLVGWFVPQKLCISVGMGESAKVYKFGVLNASGWTNSIQDALDDM